MDDNWTPGSPGQDDEGNNGGPPPEPDPDPNAGRPPGPDQGAYSGPPAAAPGPDQGAYSAPPAATRRSRKPLVIGIISGIVILALVGGGISWYVLTRPAPGNTARDYVSAWGSNDYATMAQLSTSGTDKVKDAYSRLNDNLGVDSTEVELGEIKDDGDSATASFTAKLSLKEAGAWSYSGTLPLTRESGEWKVKFSPATIHPELSKGQTLTRANEWGERGRVLAADGSRLDTEDASGSVKMLTGEVGTATKSALKDLGPAYRPGDPVGTGGLQETYQKRLAGTPTTSIRVAPEGKEDQAAQQSGEDAASVGSVKGSKGKDVTTALDPKVQDAASQAISDQGKPTSLVAVRPSTGAILAAANIPGGYNRAFEGGYAPGSSFKIITYEALLEAGSGPDSPMSCPKTAKVGGWDFKNSHDAEYGKQNVTEAFATSCNTALVQAADDKLDPKKLTSAAERFGMNSELKVGAPAGKPSFPTPDSTTLLAQQSIGQGKISASPLYMATVPAAIQSGSWRSPALVTKPKVEGRPKPKEIPKAGTLRPMMREVVTKGTAKKAGFGKGVHGKTGTAEYGTAKEGEDLKTHAWFVGYKGDLAFAVVVEGGGGGGDVAAPLAKKFLDGV